MGGHHPRRARAVLLAALLCVAMLVIGAGIASATSAPGAPPPGNGTPGTGPPGNGTPGTGGQAHGQPPGHGGAGHTTPAPPSRRRLATRLVYRMEVRVSGQYFFDDTIDDPFAADAFNMAYGTIIKSTEDLSVLSDWSAKSTGAFVITRNRRHVYFSTSLFGELAVLSFSDSIDTTARDTPGSTGIACENVNQSLSSPLKLLAGVGQSRSAGSDVLLYYTTTNAGLGNFVGTRQFCNGDQEALNGCEQDCTLRTVDGGEGRGRTLWNPDRLARRLAFKLPTLNDFGSPFSITRTIDGATKISTTGISNPPQLYAQRTQTQRSHLTYTFKFTPCPRHGRDFKHC